ETARRIRATVRAGDAVARVGGEEFLVLLRGLGDVAVLRRVGEDIRAAVAAAPIDAAGTSIPVTISLGAAVSGDSLDERDSLLAAADRALYAAKRGGRNRLVLIADLPGA